MKLAYVDICGFRGYQKPVRFEFAEGFTIIDGRNGVGKSTVFDAVEFALTGTISKYLDARASGESVDNYIWWTGTAAEPQARYVEVGFRDGDEIHVVKRTPRDSGSLDISSVAGRLIDHDRAPKGAIEQLCAATIIRDEHIARLSLDLKEGDRFTLLRDAIGAVDAEQWISRAHRLVSTATGRVKAVQAEVDEANATVLVARRQIDQTRSALPSTAVVNQAASQLRAALGSKAPAEALGDLARQRLAAMAQRADLIQDLVRDAQVVARLREAMPNFNSSIETATKTHLQASNAVAEASRAVGDIVAASALSQQARHLEQLVILGQQIGLADGKCPLCASGIEHSDFQAGMAAALTTAKRLDAQAVEQAQRERVLSAARITLTEASQRLEATTSQRDVALKAISDHELRCADAGLVDATEPALKRALAVLDVERNNVAANLRLMDTMSISTLLTRATEGEGTARERVAKAEFRLGRVRLAETRAKAIHDAARRAAAETLDQRLDRVLPLMSELYKRLRPHPVWGDIEYSVRGDVRRFLKLQVGDEVNPQFVFSSGQRRATGLAFLLSINLSIAWAKWRSVLLDDPVQHVDDFRTVHLAEVLSHLCIGGRQIICAVEDSALADLMCRRLPVTEQSKGKRITLGAGQDGALMITSDRALLPLTSRVLSAASNAKTA